MNSRVGLRHLVNTGFGIIINEIHLDVIGLKKNYPMTLMIFRLIFGKLAYAQFGLEAFCQLILMFLP